MKLTKKLETEIRQVMDEYWASYFKGDLEKWAHFLPDNYRNIGSTEEEIWNSKQEMLNYSKAVIHQMVGTVETRNKQVQIIPLDPYFMVHEFQDFYINTGKEWVFYAKFRLSSLIQKTDDGWKVLHQHGSVPDSKAQEGESIGFEKISKENLELREAVKRRTVELEQKNRELEIEACLERVRAKTMAMQKSDELAEVSSLLFQQMMSLGVHSYSSGFTIWDIDNNDLVSWMCNADGSMNPPFRMPIDGDAWHVLQFESWKNGEDFVVNEMSGEVMQSYFRYLRSFPLLDEAFKTSIAAGHPMPERQVHNVANFSQGNLLFITLEPCPEAHDIFKRFAKVFDQTYTRFLDLQKAEAQAREAQIEAALEKIRSRTMAMQHSRELQEAADLLFQQVMALGVPAWSCGYNIWEKDEKVCTGWMNSKGPDQPAFKIPLTENPTFIRFYDSRQKGELFYIEEKAGQVLEADYRYMLSLPILGEQMKEFLNAGFTFPTFQINHVVNFSHGNLIFITYQPVPEAHDIFKRFAKVFDQTYTRFLDLQKAEAQAREAQIELVLERVRARTMAMQKSDELTEVAGLLFDQVTALGIKTWTAGFNVWHEDNNSYVDYITSPNGGFIEPYTVHTKMAELLTEVSDARQSGEEFFVQYAEGERLKETYLALSRFGDEKQYEKMLEDGFQFPSHQYDHFVFGSKVSLMFITYEPVPEAHDIFKRLGKVFEQTYTRFLDLQKAEAQAREARIETALEKIRSRSLGMHHSVEIKDVVSILFEKLKELDLVFDGGAAIHLFTEGSKEAVIWVASPDLSQTTCVNLPYDENAFENNPIILDVWDAKETGASIYNKFYSFEEKNKYFNYVFKHNDLITIPGSAREFILQADSYTASFIAKKNSMLGANSWTRQLFSDSDFEILQRIATVFEQAYIRFLDLQKAEAQAREAKIEAGLERVRSRAMAMHKTDELLDAAGLVYKELSALGITSMNISYAFVDEEEKYGSYYSLNPVTGKIPPFPFVFPHTETDVMRSILSGWKKQEPVHVIELDEEATLKHQTYIGEHILQLITKNKSDIPFSVEQFLAVSPKKAVIYTFNFNKGYLFNIGESRLTRVQEELVLRFTRVFEMTYRRFLDLKQAEAQAREAQIELALERVRARTMGMQRSEELKEIIQVVYEQFVHLNIHVEHTGFVMDYKARNDYDIWIADRHGVPSQVIIPYFDSVYYNRFNEAKEKGMNFFATNLTFEEKNRFYQTLFEYVPGLTEEAKEFYFSCPGLAASTVLLENVCLYIENFSGISYSDEENATLMRFGNVFQQTYTRFLDLQKAEAQARESQIELGLERVRAKAMAMQRSDELRECVLVIYEQLQHLDFDSNACNIIIIDKESGDTHYWVSGFTQKIFPEGYQVPYLDHPYHENLLSACRKNEKYVVMEYSGKMKQSFDEIFFTQTDFRNIPEQAKEFMIGLKTVKLSTAFFTYGALQVLGPEALSEDKAGILQRFGKVFEQTYTRFLDLQKAEAQAREAKIEAALEKVRARTMGMQHSDELKEAASLLFQQVISLGIPAFTCGYNIWEKHEKECSTWMSDLNGAINPAVKIPLTEDSNFIRFYESRQKGEDFYVIEMRGEKMQEHYRYLRKIPEVNQAFNELKKAGLSLSETQVHHVVNFSEGNLIFITSEPCPDAYDIFKRFGKVFEQTYTRFLDLQKAEAQTRESQVQLALERVRARAMAMHSADELIEIANVLREQMGLLGQPELETMAVHLYKEDSEYFESWYALRASDNPADKILNGTAVFKKDSCQVVREFVEYYYAGKKEYTVEVSGSKREEWFKVLVKAAPVVMESVYERFDDIPEKTYFHFTDFSGGSLLMVSYQPPSEEGCDLQRRVTTVFDLAYRRFLDLQKAEAQARESQIQLALERVRARTMAMQHSDELKDAAALLFQQVQSLGMSAWSAGYCIWDEDKQAITAWMSSEGVLQLPFRAPLTEDPSFIHFREASERGETFFVEEIGGEELAAHYKYVRSQPVGSEIQDSIVEAGHPLPTFQIFHCAYFSKGFLLFITYEPVPEEWDIFKRLAKVFEQTYTRFLDLQKAEAQSREAQIELGLERVRARAMAMQRSSELKELIGTVFTELTKLDLVLTRCVIMIYDPATKDSTWWMANSEAPSDPIGLVVQYHEYPCYLAYVNAWEEKKLKWEYVLEGKIKSDWDDFLFTETGLKGLPDFVIAGMKAPDKVYLNASFNSFGNLTLATLDQLSDEHFNIMLRFAKVFDLTYTRFNDLQKAEAQAREAQIEAALERVRGRTMAMHHSNELLNVITELGEQFRHLGFNLDTANFNTNYRSIDWDLWMYTNNSNPTLIHIPQFDHPIFNKITTALDKGLDFIADTLNWEEKNSFNEHLFENTILRHVSEAAKQDLVKRKGFAWSVAFSKNTSVTIGNYDGVPYTDEQNAILRRFANVFEQTYTRFLDLQKAEAQAKEAKIEAALERVRGKAMAMHNSQDLTATIGVFYRELQIFSITPRRCGVGLLNKETRIAELSTMNTTEQGDSIEVVGVLKMQDHPVLEGVYDNWLLQKEYHPVLRGNEIREYYQLLRPQVAFPDYPNDAIQYGYFFFFDEGGVYAWTEKEMNEDELQIYRRFTSVLSLTYKRYIDLKQVEANAKDAVKQAALDRIRAEIASMRTISDLDKITPLIWNELTILGISFIRCGVFIMDDSHQLMHSFLSTPDGKALAAFHLPYTTPGNMAQVLNHWHDKKNYIDHWDESAFTEFANILVMQGDLASAEQYLQTIPHDGFYLHFLPFLQGMLYVGNTTQLGEEDIKLIQSVADAFSTAYARYEDFNKLDAAKKQVDTALNELQITQKQLVHSEKMASLGELTAGIAHEIQNPLNFVNNFSEVSAELVAEMNDEIKKGNLEDAAAIANDLKQNLEKINHHGKRAGNIVKGMLQHSRSGAATKEPTDINKLTDEYVRLAYHGLRAKDKTFNISLQTDYDEEIGNISIIPQDIGRVVLNLITNASYVVTEKKKLGIAGYEPTVSIRTKKKGGIISIAVKDNGNGIPQKVFDKIFQPFFTTKPAGQGTGLGLSLAYDIVKAHGGELKVETMEGQGSTFFIQLPVN